MSLANGSLFDRITVLILTVNLPSVYESSSITSISISFVRATDTCSRWCYGDYDSSGEAVREPILGATDL